MDKVFKDYNEQVNLLINRGLSANNDNEKANIRRCLQRVGYYKLINGYKQLFLDKNSNGDHFKSGTTVAQINAVYDFDKQLRSILLDNILIVETNIKNLISHVFSEKYGHDNYLLYKNFNTTKQSSLIVNLIALIQRQIAQASKDSSISHYLSNYGYIPLWILNNVLTLGTVSKFYSLMKTEDRQSVSKIFHLNDKELESLLFYISSVRNFCAHGNRIYCYRSKNPIVTLSYHDKLGIARKNDEPVCGKRDLFALLIALKPLLSKTKFTRMMQRIENAIKKVEKPLYVITTDDILEMMGFPENWKDLKNQLK